MAGQTRAGREPRYSSSHRTWEKSLEKVYIFMFCLPCSMSPARPGLCKQKLHELSPRLEAHSTNPDAEIYLYSHSHHTKPSLPA